MAAIFAFKCRSCDEIHEGSPSFAFRAPDAYASLSAEDKARMGSIDEDLCVITREEGVDRFIRAVLEVPIHGVEDPFLWGVWVSVSEKSFDRYRGTLDAPVEGEGFFGWVANRISLYPYDENRPADVNLQLDGDRPKVVLHSAEEETDSLVIDQRDGISIQRAQELAERAMHGISRRRER
ncbi:DUF2199 domain-containing protein [Roseateles chitinivorans]|uniref:DUF2199 domain-containing protein n=1 Tax=Roseateles chitinivorans TaxID=2917965 RepID=UPI003D6735BE